DDDRHGWQLALDPLGRLDPARRGQGEVHQDDVRRGVERGIHGAAGVLGLAHDLHVRFLREDLGDAHPEQDVVVDDQDSDLLFAEPPPPLWAAVLHRTHVVSSAPLGTAIRTTVPPSGRDRTSNLAPINSARSRMNCRPKLRRPLAATTPTSKPRPSSRTSMLQPSGSRLALIVTCRAWAWRLTFWRASWMI